MTAQRKFNSYEELQNFIEEYEEKTFVQLWKADSRTIEGARKRGLQRYIKNELKYTEIVYKCIHGGNWKSQSKGIRPKQRYINNFKIW